MDEKQVCPVCGVVEGDQEPIFWEGNATHRPPVFLEYAGETCSQECARALYLANAIDGVALWLQGIGFHLTGEQVSFQRAK